MHRQSLIKVAEEVGFEPTVSFPTTVFETVPFGRSGIPPRYRLVRSGTGASPAVRPECSELGGAMPLSPEEVP